MGVDMWEDLYKSFWMIGRWVGLAHAPQIYCFSPFCGVLSMFRVFSLNYWRIFVRYTTRVEFSRFFTHEQACCCTAVSDQVAATLIYSFYIECLFLIDLVWLLSDGLELYTERTFIRYSGWLTGGRGLHTRHKYTVFHRFGVFYQCLGSIHSIIDGYSYVTRLG